LVSRYGAQWSKIGTVICRSRDAVRRRASTLGIKPSTLDNKALVTALRKTVQGLESESKQLHARLGELRDMRDLLVGSCDSLSPKPSAFRMPRQWRNKKPFPATALTGDWQIGEVINATETSGWGNFNYAIAEARVQRYVEKFLAWVETLRSGYAIKTFHILGLGDFVSGNIHLELSETNEWPAPVAAVKAGDLFGRFIQGLAPHAKTVEVDFLGPDNHGRLTQKRRYKKAAFDNWNYIVFETARARLAEHAHVHMRYRVEAVANCSLDGYPVLAMHGDNLRAYMGLPYYNAQRFRGQQAIAHMEAGRLFRKIICGHWHNPARPPGVFFNGCLSGTTELDCTYGRHAPPSQTSFMVHPKHGPFNVSDWNLMVPEARKEKA